MVFLAFSTPFLMASGNFTRFPETISDTALTVPNDNDGTEAETATAFDHFGYTADMNDLIDQLVFFCILLEQGSASLTGMY
jgi:hypothetical protein